MKTLLVGDGPGATAALGALQSPPRTVVAARVSSRRVPDGLPGHATVEDALASDPVDLVVFAGEFTAEMVTAIVQRTLPVLLIDAPKSPGLQLRTLMGATSAGRAGIHVARDPGYAGCTAAVKRFLAAGRLGSIGHVSVEDDRAATQGADDGARHWLTRGGVLLAQASEVLDCATRNVMARIDDRHGVTEAYLETRRSIHVHYTGRWRAAADSHCLWIEGTKGSLKVDGRGTWWRKRGWRFFVPVRVGGIPGTAPPGFALDRATAYSRSPSAGADDRAVLGIALAALTSAMDRQPVSLADDAIEVAA